MASLLTNTCKIWTSEPDCFTLNLINLMPGLNTYNLDCISLTRQRGILTQWLSSGDNPLRLRFRCEYREEKLLIDLKRKTIFIAGIKTASTTIENMFEKKVDIRLVRSEWGKHDSVGAVEEKFSWVFSRYPIEEFLVWGVIRDPFDWLWSMYSSHRDEKFSDTKLLYTGDMSFDEFYSTWRTRHPSQCQPQSLRFKRRGRDQIFANILIPFEKLHKGLELMAPKYGMSLGQLPHKNKSPQGGPQHFAQTEEKILEDYREDFATLRNAKLKFGDLRPEQHHLSGPT